VKERVTPDTYIPSYYSPRTVTNRKPSLRTKRDIEDNRRARVAYVKLLRGMQGHRCYAVTLIKGRGLDLDLRADAWSMVRTRCGQRWPDTFEAWTGYEYGPQRGVHLNVVIKGTPGLTREWIEHMLMLIDDGTCVGYFREVYGAEGLARYWTKEIRDARKNNHWPRGFRPFTTTRGWCPEWMTRKQWRAHRRNPLRLGDRDD
jgi:hypothetical protein